MFSIESGLDFPWIQEYIPAKVWGQNRPTKGFDMLYVITALVVVVSVISYRIAKKEVENIKKSDKPPPY